MQRILPPFRSSLPSCATSGERGFSLVELLSVMAIVALTASLAVPAISSLGKSSELSSGARMVSNMLTSARTEAITQRAVTRMAIATDWPGDADARYRKMSIWRQDPSATNSWQQIGPWMQLPQSVTFEPGSPNYVPGSVPANYLLGGTQNTFTASVRGATVTMKYAEFLPSGAVRPLATGSEIWLTVASGKLDGQSLLYTVATSSGAPVNWAKISANTLTGRLRVSQP